MPEESQNEFSINDLRPLGHDSLGRMLERLNADERMHGTPYMAAIQQAWADTMRQQTAPEPLERLAMDLKTIGLGVRVWEHHETMTVRMLIHALADESLGVVRVIENREIRNTRGAAYRHHAEIAATEVIGLMQERGGIC